MADMIALLKITPDLTQYPSGFSQYPAAAEMPAQYLPLLGCLLPAAQSC